MRKEYSDLPASQKITYMKRAVVIIICTVIPILIFFAIAIHAAMYYAPMINDDIIPTNSTESTTTEKEEMTATSDFTSALFIIVLLIPFFGMIELGSSIGIWFANKLNLYTDFELEYAERTLAEIKKVLENTKSESSKA